MSEGLSPKRITIIRIISMLAGVLGSLVMLLEYDFFHFGPAQRTTFSNTLVGLVGVLCFLNLLRHLLTLWRLRS